MLVLSLLLLVLFDFAGSANAREKVQHHRRAPIFYNCPHGNVLTVYNKSNELSYTITQCSPPIICGKPMTCVMSTGSTCAPRFSYMTGVDESKGCIISSCCQLTPDSQAEEFCYSIDFHNRHYKLVTRDEDFVDYDADFAQLDHSGHSRHVSHVPSTQIKAHNQHTGTEGATKEISLLVRLMFLNVTDIRPVYEYVKGISKTEKGYKMTTCTVHCRSTSTVTTRKPTTQKLSTHITAPTPTAKPAEEQHQKKGLFGKLGSGHRCFSRDMMVMTPNGLRRMDQLIAGDEEKFMCHAPLLENLASLTECRCTALDTEIRVQVITPDSGTQFHPIAWFYHNDPGLNMTFISMQTKSGHHLSISANHLVPFVPCTPELMTPRRVETLTFLAKFASKAKVGMCLAIKQDTNIVADPIVSIKSEVKNGVYSPITGTGSLLVNGIQVSCYSSFENQHIQQTVHSIVIKIDHMICAIQRLIWHDIEIKKEEKEIPRVLSFLLQFAKHVLPDHVFD